MKIKNLLENYSLHDSTIEKINYDKINKNLTVTIDFCYWMQNDFANGNKENGIVDLVFHEVNDYDNLKGNIDSFGILDAKEEEKGLWLNIEDAFNNKFYNLIINASDVDFIEKD